MYVLLSDICLIYVKTSKLLWYYENTIKYIFQINFKTVFTKNFTFCSCGSSGCGGCGGCCGPCCATPCCPMPSCVAIAPTCCNSFNVPMCLPTCSACAAPSCCGPCSCSRYGLRGPRICNGCW